jgi:hypothetical protein
LAKVFRPFDEIVKLRKALAPNSRLYIGFGDQQRGKDCFERVLRMVALIMDGINWRKDLNFRQDINRG